MLNPISVNASELSKIVPHGYILAKVLEKYDIEIGVFDSIFAAQEFIEELEKHEKEVSR